MDGITQGSFTQDEIVNKREEYEAACNIWRSLQNHAEPEKMRRAAEYSDQWFAWKHSHLNVTTCANQDAPQGASQSAGP